MSVSGKQKRGAGQSSLFILFGWFHESHELHGLCVYFWVVSDRYGNFEAGNHARSPTSDNDMHSCSVRVAAWSDAPTGSLLLTQIVTVGMSSAMT